MRLFSAFAILPFVAAALAFAGFPLFALTARAQLGVAPDAGNDAAMAFAGGTFIVAALVTVVSVPIVSRMLRRGPLSYPQALVGGIALGNAPFLLVVAAILIVSVFTKAPSSAGTHWYGVSGALRTITLSTLLGGTLGSVFWVVGIRSRSPERGPERPGAPTS